MKIIDKNDNFDKKVFEFYKEFHITPVDTESNENIINAEGNYIKVWDRVSKDLKVKAAQSKFIL